jgi:hypothetical protein
MVESMRKRHAYGATDNILVDFRATDSDGRVWMMGDSIEVKTAPRFTIKVVGTAAIDRIEVIKNSQFV